MILEHHSLCALMERAVARCLCRSVWLECAIALVLTGSLSAQLASMDGWPNVDASERLPQGWPPLVHQEGLSIVLEEDRHPEFSAPLVSPERRYVSSVVTLHELSHRVPSRAKRDFERALKAIGRQDDETAITYLKKAIEADPEYCAAWNNLGAAYLQLDRTELAIEQFIKAIEVDPHAAKPQLNLANAYIRQQLYADAVRAARRGIDLDRGDPSGPLILGMALVLEHKFTPEAERNLVKASQTFVFAELWLAVGLATRGDVVNAKEQVKRYIAETHVSDSNPVMRLLAELERRTAGAQ